MIAVVYSKAQRVRRRLIKLDHPNAKLEDFNPHKNLLHEGEGWLEIPTQIYGTFKDAYELDAYIAEQIGESLSDRCAVISDAGNVLHIIRADPAIDFHPDGDLVAHDKVEKDWKFTNEQWVIPEKQEVISEQDPRVLQDMFEENVSSAKFNSFGTDWNIQCVGDDLIIGCQTLPISTWEKFTDAEVGLLSEPIIQTAKWWRDNRDDILNFAYEHQKRLQK